MRHTGHQPPKSGEFFAFDQGVLRLGQIAQGSLGRIPGFSRLAFTRLQCRFGALAFGDFFGRHVDADNLAGPVAQRVPIGDPCTFLRLVGALASDLDARHRLAGLHDRANDGLDRFGEGRHALAHGATEMIFDGNAAYLGKTLVDVQIAAIARQDGKANGRGIVDRLQRGLLGKRHAKMRGQFHGSGLALYVIWQGHAFPRTRR